MDSHRSLIPRFCRAASLILTLFFSNGCISLRPVSRVPSSEAIALEGVPLAQFGAQNCGAASLSAVFAYWGHEVPTDELDQTLPKAKKGGVLLLDMLLAARDLGFSAELIFGEPTILRGSIEAGRPLILMLRVFDSIGDSRDLYHYVIVDGFDSEGDLARIQYGDGAARWVSLERLSRSWDDTDFATLVIQPGDGGLDVTPLIRYAVALEEQGRLDEAVSVYEQVLEDDPGSALAWTNLGNVEAARKRLAEAEAAYRRALEIDPNNVDTLNNLAWLLLENRSDLDMARELAARAVALGGADSYLALDTLGRIELATDRCEEAIDAFSKALEAVPLDAAARAATREIEIGDRHPFQAKSLPAATFPSVSRILDTLLAELHGRIRLLAKKHSVERLEDQDNAIQRVVNKIEVRKGG